MSKAWEYGGTESFGTILELPIRGGLCLCRRGKQKMMNNCEFEKMARYEIEEINDFEMMSLQMAQTTL